MKNSQLLAVTEKRLQAKFIEKKKTNEQNKNVMKV